MSNTPKRTRNRNRGRRSRFYVVTKGMSRAKRKLLLTPTHRFNHDHEAFAKSRAELMKGTMQGTSITSILMDCYEQGIPD